MVYSINNHQNSSDNILWASFKNGDRGAFAALYYRYSPILFHACLRMCSDSNLIEDNIQDLFVEIWKNKSGLNYPTCVKAYLVRSLQRKILRQLKKDRSSASTLDVNHITGTSTPSIETEIIRQQIVQEQKRKLKLLINGLTRRQQEALYLRFYANLSYPEIAGKMSISTDSIYNLISKAIGNMQRNLSSMQLQAY